MIRFIFLALIVLGVVVILLSVIAAWRQKNILKATQDDKENG